MSARRLPKSSVNLPIPSMAKLSREQLERNSSSGGGGATMRNNGGDKVQLDCRLGSFQCLAKTKVGHQVQNRANLQATNGQDKPATSIGMWKNRIPPLLVYILAHGNATIHAWLITTRNPLNACMIARGITTKKIV
jgi:hypothetical protein